MQVTINGKVVDLDSVSESMKRAFVGIYVTIAIISLAIGVVALIGMWKMFKKAGIPGWHAIIPFLNIWDLINISWTKAMAKLTIIFTIISTVGITVFVFILGSHATVVEDNIATVSGLSSGWAILGAISYVIALVAGIFMAIATCKLAKVFGKDIGFAVLLFFFSPIMVCILGFGHAQYIGFYGDNTIDKFFPYNQTQQTMKTQTVDENNTDEKQDTEM